jgi:hypothetical protein
MSGRLSAPVIRGLLVSYQSRIKRKPLKLSGAADDRSKFRVKQTDLADSAKLVWISSAFVICRYLSQGNPHAVG